MTDSRRALLVAALAAVLVKSCEPEFAMIHTWLDSWSGLGAIVVGMRRHGYELRLDSDREGWKATFLHRSHIYYPTRAKAACIVSHAAAHTGAGAFLILQRRRVARSRGHSS
jgi:hypothetical protein